MNQVIQRRSRLLNTRRSLKRGKLSIGVIGGSISEADTESRWPEPIISWFLEQYPELRIHVENVAIGATGSEFGVFRAERDIVDNECDLIFVEFAVNDQAVDSEKRVRTMEGLLRKLLVNGKSDVVLVYTFSKLMFGMMMEDKIPESIFDFEILAQHYGINSIWMGLKALDDLKKGKIKWKEWLPDGLHPEHRGSLCYAESVIKFLQEELQGNKNIQLSKLDVSKAILIEPYNKYCWDKTESFSFEKVHLEGPWVTRKWTRSPWYDTILETASPVAKLCFEFEGRGLSIGFMFGKLSADFRYRLDGGEWIECLPDRSMWCPEKETWHRVLNIVDDLKYGVHHFEYEVMFRSNVIECIATNTKIGFLGIIK